MNNASIRVVVPQIVFLIYFQIVEWVSLYPWNDFSYGNSQQPFDLVLGIVQITLVIWTFRRSKWSLRISLVFYAIWLTLQVLNWWVPYFFGASESIREVYLRMFGRTIKFLPPIGNHPIPDANHVVISTHVVLHYPKDCELNGTGSREKIDQLPAQLNSNRP